MKTARAPVWTALVLAALAACSGKEAEAPRAAQAPALNCEADAIRTQLIQEFAGKLEEEGAKGFSSAALSEALGLRDIVPVERDTGTGHYRCTATVVVHYPNELPGKIAEALSDDAGRRALRTKLEDRFGIVHGSGVFNQLHAAIADGPFGFVPAVPEPGTIGRHREAILKNTEALFPDRIRVPIGYELRSTRDADGKPGRALKWQINARDGLDLNVVLLSLRGIL
jgi:hypothetical protein